MASFLTPYLSSTRFVALGAGVVATMLAGCAGDVEVDDAASESSSITAEPRDFDEASRDPNYVLTPVGVMHRDCVVDLPDDATVDEDDEDAITLADGSRRQLSPCTHPSFVRARKAPTESPLDVEDLVRGPAPEAAPPPDDEDGAGSADSLPIAEEDMPDADETDDDAPASAQEPSVNGWIAASWWDSSRPMRKLTENFRVPKKPRKNGALVYLFPSFEPADGSLIVQPVLQWGNNGAFGGNYWVIASWYVGNKHGGHSKPIRVSPGDSLAGTILGKDCSSGARKCLWHITTKSRALGKSTSFKARSRPQYRAVQGGVLEVYHLTGCNQLPRNHEATFSGLRVYDGGLTRRTPHFANEIFDTLCRVKVSHTTTSTKISWSHF